MNSLYDQRDKVLMLLDRGDWKNSWQLPRDKHGYIDWWHPDTTKKVKKEKEAAIRQAHALIALANSITVPEQRYDGEWNKELRAWEVS